TVLEKLPKERKIGGVTINVKNLKILRRYSEDFYVVTYSLNAGCLFPLSTLSQLRFNEDLFLDRVDFDFNLKMKKKGLLMLGYKEQMLDHQAGKIIRYVQNKNIIKIIKFLEFFCPYLRKHKAERGIAVSHKPFRNYLIIRNNAYLLIRNIPYLDKVFLNNIFILGDLSAFMEIWELEGFFKALKLFLRANIVGLLGHLREDNKRFLEKDFNV
ncbi:MAG: hypothetical protein JZD40_07650, partial [Sulfolobus sp.]|nr:hypothetical protein [Sulfolobus sp.]